MKYPDFSSILAITNLLSKNYSIKNNLCISINKNKRYKRLVRFFRTTMIKIFLKDKYLLNLCPLKNDTPEKRGILFYQII